LAQVGSAGDRLGLLARLGQRWQQHCYEYCDNTNYNQKLDKRKSTLPMCTNGHHGLLVERDFARWTNSYTCRQRALRGFSEFSPIEILLNGKGETGYFVWRLNSIAA
jgi:hypothetical protein